VNRMWSLCIHAITIQLYTLSTVSTTSSRAKIWPGRGIYLVCLPRPRPLAPLFVFIVAGVPVVLPFAPMIGLQILQSQFPVGAAVNPAQAIWNHSMGQSSFWMSASLDSALVHDSLRHKPSSVALARITCADYETYLAVRDLIAITISWLVPVCQNAPSRLARNVRVSISELRRHNDSIERRSRSSVSNSATSPRSTSASTPTPGCSTFPPGPASSSPNRTLVEICQGPSITILQPMLDRCGW